MRRLAASIGLLFSITACSDAHRVSGPFDQSATTISIKLSVRGDITAADREYPLYIDNSPVGKIRPGEVFQTSITGGAHTVALHPPFIVSISSSVSWCSLSSPTAIFVSGGRPAFVSLDANCPSLDGVGSFALTLNTSTPPVGDLINVTLTRTNGSEFSTTFTSVPNIARVVALPPGIYLIKVDPPCALPPPTLFTLNHLVVIRSAQTSHQAYGVICTR